jgi:hypothetical protein
MVKLDEPMNPVEKYLYGINERLDKIIEMLEDKPVEEIKPIIQEVVKKTRKKV